MPDTQTKPSIKKPKAEDLKEIFLASQSHAIPYLKNIKHWEDLILAKPRTDKEDINRGKRVKTRSNIEVKHVRKLLEWRYPVLEQAFLSRKDLFNPTGRDAMDADVAGYHKKVLNYQMNNEIDKVSFITRMVRAYLNQGTVVVHLGWRAEKGRPTIAVPVFDYGYVQEGSEIHRMLEAKYIETLATLSETPQARSSLPSHIIEGADYYSKYNRVVDVTITDFVKKKTDEEVWIHNHPTLHVVNIYDVFAAPECKTNIQDSPYVIYRFEKSIHELENTSDYNTAKVNWDVVGTTDSGSNNVLGAIYSVSDKRRQVEVFEYWGLHDVDGNGTMKPCKITWVDGYVIECILNPFPDNKHPFYSAAHSPDTTLDTFYGSSDAFLAEDNQAILSAMHRGIIDMHASSAYGQRAVAKNTLDIINRQKFLNGEHFEYDPNSVDPQALFHTFTFPAIQPTTMAYMQQINADSDALTGIKSFNEGISGNSYGDTATGVAGVLSATALRESSLLGRLEDMLIQIAKRIIYLNILYLDTPKIIQLVGIDGLVIKAVSNPLIDVKLDVTNQAEDAIKAQEMSFMLQTLGQTLPPELTKRALMEVAELRNLHRFYNILDDYDVSPPEPSPQEQEIAALQIELLKAQIANEQAKGNKTNADATVSAAKANTETVSAAKVAAEAEQITVETERLASGKETADKIAVISAQAEANTAASIAKERLAQTSNVKGFTRTPAL